MRRPYSLFSPVSRPCQAFDRKVSCGRGNPLWLPQAGTDACHYQWARFSPMSSPSEGFDRKVSNYF